MLHDPKDAGVHHINAHHGGELQDADLAPTCADSVESFIFDTRRFQKLTAEPDDERFILCESVQRTIGVNRMDRFFTGARLKTESDMGTPNIIRICRPGGRADCEL